MRGSVFSLSMMAATFLIGSASYSAAAQEAEDWWFDDGSSVGISVGASALMGFGASIGVPVGDRFNIRGVYNGLSFEDELEEESDGGGVTVYDASLELKSYGILADWHPFKGAFRFTTGLLSNKNRLGLVAQSNGGVIDINDCSYQSDPSDPLMVAGGLDWKSTAPYAGIGWGGNMNADPGFYATFDLGVMFSGAPRSRLSATGMAQAVGPNAQSCAQASSGPVDAATDPEIQAEVRQAKAELDEDTADFKLWPNIALGFGWRF